MATISKISLNGTVYDLPSGGGGSSTDVRINNTSITSSGIANIVTESVYDATNNKIATMADISGGGSTDVQINGTSIVSSDVANIATEGTYNATTNKIATMSDVSALVTASTTDISEGDPLATGTLYVVYE